MGFHLRQKNSHQGELTQEERSSAGVISLLVKIFTKVIGKFGKVISFLTKGKAGVAVSTAAWSAIASWEFAAMLMFGLVIHELGHVWAMKHVGLRIRALNFIPLFGAMVIPEEDFRSRREEAFVAIMGPVFGLTAAILIGIGYVVTDNPKFAAGAAFTAFLNLFNLIPVSPLDGGRILKSVAFSIHSRVGLGFMIFGLIACTALLYFGISWFAGFILVMGSLDLLGEYSKRNKVPKMNTRLTVLSAGAYITVTVFAFALMDYMEHVPGADLAMKALTS